MKTSQKYLVVVAVVCGLIFASPARAALVLQFDSANYVTGTWTDTSGSGNNATQGTVSKQPTLVAGATPSGQSALQFDGSNDLLSLTTALSGAPFTSSPNLTIVTVVSNQKGDAGTSTFIGGDSANFYMAGGVVGPPNIGRLYLSNYGASTGGYSDPLPDDSNWIIYATTYDGSSHKFYTNGVQVTTGYNDTVAFSNPITKIGAMASDVNLLEGQMAALYVYDTALDATALATISSQLYATYLVEVPEPSVALLLGVGGLLALARRLVRRSSSSSEGGRRRTK